MITKDDWLILVARLVGEVGDALTEEEKLVAIKFAALARWHVQRISTELLTRP